MPLYTMENNGEFREFFFTMDNAPPLGQTVKIEGEEWRRAIIQAPYGVVKGSQNPTSSQAFVENTANRKGTIGSLLDESKELSEKRKKIYDGRDPIQEKWFDKWSAKRDGKQHPADTRSKKSTPLKVKK